MLISLLGLLAITAVVCLAVILLIYAIDPKLAAKAHQDMLLGGPVNQEVICPHCQTRGQVRVQETTVKTGLSGGKATAALLTGGATLIATGLSSKTKSTSMACGHCHVTWTIS